MASWSFLQPWASWEKTCHLSHSSLLSVSSPPLAPFPYPLLSPPFLFLSESQPPATSLRRSESCLSSREMGPAVCETTDMRYEKWEMREQTDTHAHLDKHSHILMHTHTQRLIFLYQEPSGLNKLTARLEHLSLTMNLGSCNKMTALWDMFFITFFFCLVYFPQQTISCYGRYIARFQTSDFLNALETI